MSCLIIRTFFGIIILYRFIKLMLVAVALVDFFQREGNYMGG